MILIAGVIAAAALLICWELRGIAAWSEQAVAELQAIRKELDPAKYGSIGHEIVRQIRSVEDKISQRSLPFSDDD
jgi:hypothetical protein